MAALRGNAQVEYADEDIVMQPTVEAHAVLLPPQYGSSTALLWSIRRTVSPAAVRVLTFGLAACALAFVFLLFVLARRFFYAE